MSFLKRGLTWMAVGLLIFFFGCGTYENPHDPALSEEDSDGDGIKNGEDPDPKIPNNVVKSPSGSVGTSTNLSKNFVFFNGGETFDVSVGLAPDGYYLPSLDEVKAGIASGELLSVKNRIWTTTKVSTTSSDYSAIIPSNGDVISANGSSNKLSAVFKKR